MASLVRTTASRTSVPASSLRAFPGVASCPGLSLARAPAVRSVVAAVRSEPAALRTMASATAPASVMSPISHVAGTVLYEGVSNSGTGRGGSWMGLAALGAASGAAVAAADDAKASTRDTKPFEPIPSVEHFFKTAPAPSHLPAAKRDMFEFVKHHIAAGRRVALVTSGGTTVPLEVNTVRFVDNFSTGTRGARSVEELLKLGYAVIMLTRTGSVQPFERVFAKFARDLDLHVDGVADCREDISKADDVELTPDATHATIVGLDEEIIAALRARRRVRAEGTLMRVPFVTISEYLHLLRAAGESIHDAGAGAKALLYLAAAVSDFYVPQEDMAVHKIQSKGGNTEMDLALKPVPKTLGYLRYKWCPEAMTVSFKLETDASMLMGKAQGAMAKYGVHYVLANMLDRRYDEIFVIAPKGQAGGGLIVRDEKTKAIEQQFVPYVAQLHTRFATKA